MNTDQFPVRILVVFHPVYYLDNSQHFLNDGTCITSCPDFDAPICGKSVADGTYRTYKNMCFLRKAICETKTGIKFIKKGGCCK